MEHIHIQLKYLQKEKIEFIDKYISLSEKFQKYPRGNKFDELW